MEPTTLQAELTKTVDLGPLMAPKTEQGEEIEINVTNQPVIDYGLRDRKSVV